MQEYATDFLSLVLLLETSSAAGFFVYKGLEKYKPAYLKTLKKKISFSHDNKQNDSIKNFEIESHNSLIEEILQNYCNKKKLDQDYWRYKHHVYRVYNLAIMQASEFGPVSKIEKEKLAVSAAFHDMGFWSKNTNIFDICDFSIELARSWLVKHGRNKVFEETIISIIKSHHHSKKKLNEDSKDILLIKWFKTAHEIDLSCGLKTFGYNQADINRCRQSFPELSFFRVLIFRSFEKVLRMPFDLLKLIPKFIMKNLAIKAL
ncbi:hypothetical protein HK099_008024 [Clydaea vesicula]|uniref:HD domain-containing protein n=1 Tax=Clydaea vesicula TaxID=447962 RepID=A0AAD5U6G4_9FUNG|nr:hypothetical protein HK099_008024 [Clydaea vesicula]KAJ3391736.1 hypothetical protein HDU92_008880 [Lobulomyces angularis]